MNGPSLPDALTMLRDVELPAELGAVEVTWFTGEDGRVHLMSHDDITLDVLTATIGPLSVFLGSPRCTKRSCKPWSAKLGPEVALVARIYQAYAEALRNEQSGRPGNVALRPSKQAKILHPFDRLLAQSPVRSDLVDVARAHFEEAMAQRSAAAVLTLASDASRAEAIDRLIDFTLARRGVYDAVNKMLATTNPPRYRFQSSDDPRTDWRVVDHVTLDRLQQGLVGITPETLPQLELVSWDSLIAQRSPDDDSLFETLVRAWRTLVADLIDATRAEVATMTIELRNDPTTYLLAFPSEDYLYATLGTQPVFDLLVSYSGDPRRRVAVVPAAVAHAFLVQDAWRELVVEITEEPSARQLEALFAIWPPVDRESPYNDLRTALDAAALL